MDNQKEISQALINGQLIGFINSMKYWKSTVPGVRITSPAAFEAFIENELRKIKNNSRV
jgi:hypothetical protein